MVHPAFFQISPVNTTSPRPCRARLAHEAAALSAQLSVGNASLTALLAQHGQTQQLALETRAREMLGAVQKSGGFFTNKNRGIHGM